MAYPFDYVYHFKAKFRPGLNIVQHTYEYDLSFSVGEEFHFPYVLTAANRWANHQIDDFTLNINMGDHESFRIKQTFFDKSTDWTINGLGMAMKCDWPTWDTVKNGVIFHIQKGSVSFHKQNFHPDGELHVAKDALIICMWSDWNNDQKTTEEEQLIKGIKNQYFSLDTAFISGYFEKVPQFTPEQRRILKNCLSPTEVTNSRTRHYGNILNPPNGTSATRSTRATWKGSPKRRGSGWNSGSDFFRNFARSN